MLTPNHKTTIYNREKIHHTGGQLNIRANKLVYVLINEGIPNKDRVAKISNN